LLAPDLASLPPAYLVLPECDPLHDEGLAYAERLVAAGISTVTAQYAGMFHGFFNMDHLLPEAAEASSAAYAWLKARLRS
jgi:acetyl esterase